MRVRERGDPQATSPRLGELLRRLISEIRTLIDQRLTLLRIELKEQLAAAARDVALIAAGAVLLIIASLLLLAAIALWVGQMLGNVAGGFGLLGAVALVLSGAMIGIGVAQLKRRRLAPKTRDELRRDVEWIKTGT